MRLIGGSGGLIEICYNPFDAVINSDHYLIGTRPFDRLRMRIKKDFDFVTVTA